MCASMSLALLLTCVGDTRDFMVDRMYRVHVDDDFSRSLLRKCFDMMIVWGVIGSLFGLLALYNGDNVACNDDKRHRD
jgi:hypothetical protein